MLNKNLYNYLFGFEKHFAGYKEIKYLTFGGELFIFIMSICS